MTKAPARLVLPKAVMRRLESAGVYCQRWVTVEKQARAGRWVLRGVESGESNREAGRYISFFSPERGRLFFGLSDGARIDVFRRAKVGCISNEQVVLATEINESKWDSLLKELRGSLADANARFEFIFLLNDFIATGTPLLRREEAEWKGRLPKFWGIIQQKLTTHFDADLQVIVHHYIATATAERNTKIRGLRGSIAHEEIANALGLSKVDGQENGRMEGAGTEPDFSGAWLAGQPGRITSETVRDGIEKAARRREG
jgi:hypothetical protein